MPGGFLFIRKHRHVRRIVQLLVGLYILDTNALIMAIRHPDWPIPGRIEKHVGNDVCISAITLAEMEYGAKKSQDPEATRIELYQFLTGIPVLEFDARAARYFGDILGRLS